MELQDLYLTIFISYIVTLQVTRTSSFIMKQTPGQPQTEVRRCSYSPQIN